jgi:hypothetical protein
VAGDPTLDPQYFERPDDLTHADRIRYFEPVELTDSVGRAAEWLLPYIPTTAAPRRAVKLRLDRGLAPERP